MAKKEDNMSTHNNAARNMPTPAVQRETRVGVFVILGISAVVFMLYLLTDPATFRGRYKVTTTVTDVMGLRKGDPIQMRGVPIGRVHDFNLEAQNEQVTVILEVEGKWRIPVGSRAQLVSTGIMDPRTVEIVPGPGPGEIGEGAVLPGSVAKSLFDDTESLGGKGMEVLDQIAALLSDSTIQSVDEGARYLEGILEEIAGVMGSESEEIKGLITALGSAAEDLAGATPELREELLGTVVRADSLVVTLTERVSDFEGTMASLSSVLDRINNGQGTLGKLSTDDELFHSLKDALESARFLMDDLRENPRRYINISIF